MTVESYDRVLELAQHAERGTLSSLGEALRALLTGTIETQQISAAGAITLPKAASKRVEITAGSAYAITLPAPTQPGQELVIECVSGTSNVDLALTNVQGGSAATQARFNAANEVLVLKGLAAKWQVMAETGVTLS